MIKFLVRITQGIGEIMNLVGKIALITGASRGIGKSIAMELSSLGATVIINYSKDDNEANNTLNCINATGREAFLYKCDISHFIEAHKMIDNIVNKFGKIDILVNNAGISQVGLLMDMKENDFDNIINVNLKGVFNCSHGVIPHMLKEGKGSIISISSIWGNVGASCEVIYSASKGGVNSFTMALAKELGTSGIRVNAISPGVIETDMNNFLTFDERENLVKEIPMMKFGKGEDIAKLVAFLASEDSSYITGQVIKVDGALL